MVGQFPSCRHDGSPFGSLDALSCETEVATFGLEGLSGRGPGGLGCLQGYSRFPLLVEYGPYLLALQLYEV